MGVPKKRTTKSKRNQRRSHDGLTASSVIICPNCGSKMQPHHVCLDCGEYRGKLIIEQASEVVADNAQE